jgi:hypothetical protein
MLKNWCSFFLLIFSYNPAFTQATIADSIVYSKAVDSFTILANSFGVIIK